MVIWNVEFSYSINVEAETMAEAETGARQKWDEINPTPDEMNIEVSNADE